MSFTVPSAFPVLSVTHNVYPGEIARAGDDTADDESILAVVLADRIARAKRQPALVEARWAAPLEDNGGPGAGIADWALAVDFTPFVVPARSTGDLDVYAWTVDAESTGGVYVAVYADDLTTLIDSVTMASSAAATIEELTDNLTGLTPGDTVYVIARFASKANLTNAKLYGLDLVDPSLTATDL